MRGQPAGNTSRSDASVKYQHGNGTAAWLPLHDVARALSCNRNSLLTLIEEGELVAIDIRAKGSSRALVRITADSVESFLEKHQRVTGKRARRPRISPTKMRRHPRPAGALLAALRSS